MPLDVGGRHSIHGALQGELPPRHGGDAEGLSGARGAERGCGMGGS